ncbi:toll/interleukin-1 receptor domain-containing protein [Skermanella rosea]|uniref:toll/interleukin-1 receptor domain-containing protein n=1 Tax=Skermanella rosea TaxID=1817965 RepID=UPI0019322241|nr:toll/interleukin-1 receptor domain-containing protein [Skermanella rosea]UEM04728.1 toll/interleukin-1 receptor domain-containing protein [Skermanella rosea]
MKAFISYSHKDSWALDRLHTHLAVLRREGQIETWFDRDILAGSELDHEISEQLEVCDLFLLLVSPDFLASAYCYEREMARALERHEASEARVVPIIVEPCDWRASPLHKLKALPHDAKPVVEWTNQNTAFLNIVTELRRLVPQNEPGQAPPAQPVRVRTDAPRYRVKRDFDEIDRSDFRTGAFEAIRSYFDSATNEINQVDGLRARFASLGPNSFGCTLVNRGMDRGTAHITVHSRAGNIGLGDIFYSFSENAPPNTANGSFNIEADDYDLFLKSGAFGFGGSDERVSPEQAAERLWTEFLDQAGVSHG